MAGGKLLHVSVEDVADVAGEGLRVERGSLDATRKSLKVQVGEGGCSDRGCLPSMYADADADADADDDDDDDDGEGEPISMMLRRLELWSDAERAAALNGDEADGLGPVGKGDDLGSTVSLSL